MMPRSKRYGRLRRRRHIVREDNAPGQPVVGVWLHGSGATDALLKELASLKQLRTLGIFGNPYAPTQVTDAGMKELAALNQLQTLELGFLHQVADAGLKELAALKQLRSLKIVLTPLSDAGFKDLAALKHLQSLTLNQTGVTDWGSKNWSGCNNCGRWISAAV